MGNGCKHSVLYITTLSDQFYNKSECICFIKALLLYANTTIEIEIFSGTSTEKNIIFLWETLSIENRLFHLHFFCDIFAPIKKAGVALTAVQKKIIPPTQIFQRDAVTKSTFISPCRCIILALEVQVKTVTTDRFPEWQVHTSHIVLPPSKPSVQ